MIFNWKFCANLSEKYRLSKAKFGFLGFLYYDISAQTTEPDSSLAARLTRQTQHKPVTAVRQSMIVTIVTR